MAQTSVSTPQSDPQGVSSTPLSIGGVVFRREECPKKIPGLGAGEQMQTVRKLAGGGRVINNFGTQPKTVSWTGTFWKSRVLQRVLALRGMMNAGLPVPLTWLNESYQCVIKDFEPGYRNQFRAEYTITVEVAKDTNGAFGGSPTTTIDNQVAAISAQLDNELLNITANDNSAPVTLTSSWASAKVAIKSSGPLAQLTGQQLTSTLATISSALTQYSTYAAALGVTAPTFLAAQQAVSLFTLLQKNIAAGQNTTTIQVVGGSLAEICASYYRNADLAPALMLANSLPSLFLPTSTPTTLVLPPFQKAS